MAKLAKSIFQPKINQKLYFTVDKFGDIIECVSDSSWSILDEPYRFLSSSTEDIFELIASKKIIKDDNGNINFGDIKFSRADIKYITENFDRYVAQTSAVNAPLALPPAVDPAVQVTAPVNLVAGTPSVAPLINNLAVPQASPAPVASGPIIPKAPVDSIQQNLTPGFTPASDGTIQIDLSKVVDYNNPIETTIIPNPTIDQNPAIPNVSVNPPKLKRDKSDIKDATPNPTIVEDTSIDASEILIDSCAPLQFINAHLGKDFFAKCREEDGLVKVDIFNNDNPNEPIENMGMTVDVTGGIFSPGAKFWPTTDNDKVFDFEPALKLTEEALSAHLSGEPFSEQMYNYSRSVGELNKYFNIKSVWSFEQDVTKIGEVIKKVNDMLTKNKQFKNRLGKRRMIMTEYTDSNHFVLETPEGAPAYYYGPSNNKSNTRFVIDGDKVSMENVVK